MTASHRPAALPRRTVVQYAVGSIGTGGFNTLPGLVLLYYLTDVLAVPALAAGVVVGVAKAWDVLINPSVGVLSDRSAITTGSRRRFLRMGAVALPVLFLLTFAAWPGLPTWASAVWVAVAYLLAGTAFSTFQVPYLALAAEVTGSYAERTRLLTWRIVWLTIGILVFGGAAPALRSAFADPWLGYLVMAIVAAVLILASFWIASLSAPVGIPPAERPERRAINPVRDYREAGRAIAASQPFRAVWISFLLKSLAIGLLLAVDQYVATWVLGRPGALTWIFLALVGPALLVTPLWGRLATRYGKEPLVYAASGLFTLATLSLTLLIWFPGWWLLGSLAIAGVGYAGMQSLPLSILPDVIAYEARRQGVERAGLYTSIWAGGETALLAVGAFLLSVLLGATGYISSSGDQVDQPAAAVTVIVLSLSLIPAVVTAASLLVFRGYRLRRADIEAAG